MYCADIGTLGLPKAFVEDSQRLLDFKTIETEAFGNVCYTIAFSLHLLIMFGCRAAYYLLTSGNISTLLTGSKNEEN
ncbi:hypothetical protein CU098_010547 [Rhizopus stolonifer]|uniref:Uncharacterized protein n=1 Tax=Rhizopus stolonifer TaxID=4846 RepID=A0A367KD14_RHIST|nr:hypothetical protein CU098_010547 [Rhizopus stolonifer]